MSLRTERPWLQAGGPVLPAGVRLVGLAVLGTAWAGLGYLADQRLVFCLWVPLWLVVLGALFLALAVRALGRRPRGWWSTSTWLVLVGASVIWAFAETRVHRSEVERADVVALEALVAVLQYRADRGDCPTHLDDLVPAYLDEHPVNPIGAGRDGRLEFAPTWEGRPSGIVCGRVNYQVNALTGCSASNLGVDCGD